jgi:hypothetical protein
MVTIADAERFDSERKATGWSDCILQECCLGGMRKVRTALADQTNPGALMQDLEENEEGECLSCDHGRLFRIAGVDKGAGTVQCCMVHRIARVWFSPLCSAPLLGRITA